MRRHSVPIVLRFALIHRPPDVIFDQSGFLWLKNYEEFTTILYLN